MIVSSKLSDEDVQKLIIYKLRSSGQTNIGSFKIIVPVDLAVKFSPHGIFINKFIRRQNNIAPVILVEKKKTKKSLQLLKILYQTVRGIDSKLRNTFVNSVNSDLLL